jgi:hypothetical protein
VTQAAHRSSLITNPDLSSVIQIAHPDRHHHPGPHPRHRRGGDGDRDVDKDVDKDVDRDVDVDKDVDSDEGSG